MASKLKYQNFLKKKAKEKEAEWMDKKEALGNMPCDTYRDKYRSGLRKTVEAKN